MSEQRGGATAGGLEDVVVGETSISAVDGTAGRLVYRGQDAVELAATRSFEAVWYLLHRGSLPGDEDLTAFGASVGEDRWLTPDEREIARSSGSADFASLRAATAALVARWRFEPWIDRDPEVIAVQGHRLCAVMPVLVAEGWRVSTGTGVDPIGEGPPSQAELLLRGFGRDPSPTDVEALNRYLVLTADHGMNASTFVARIVASTGADAGSAVVAAMGALSGPLHGGAPGPVLGMLDEIGRPKRAADWLRGRLDAGHRLMGFGHRVYRTDDPRALALKEIALAHGGGRAGFAAEVESSALSILAERKRSRPLRTNVEFWAAVVLEMVGVPRPMFTPVFACSRVVGWTAHVLEQVSHNRLIRPKARYVGPLPTSANGDRADRAVG